MNLPDHSLLAWLGPPMQPLVKGLLLSASPAEGAEMSGPWNPVLLTVTPMKAFITWWGEGELGLGRKTMKDLSLRGCRLRSSNPALSLGPQPGALHLWQKPVPARPPTVFLKGTLDSLRLTSITRFISAA